MLKLEGESGESEEAQETNEESGEQPPDNDQTTQDATNTDQEAQEGDKEGIAVVIQCRQKNPLVDLFYVIYWTWLSFLLFCLLCSTVIVTFVDARFLVIMKFFSILSVTLSAGLPL